MTKLTNFPPVYYISLEESEDRRKHLHEQFESYGVTNLTGIISKRFSECDENIEGEFVHTLSDSCKGSIISHIKCFQNFLCHSDHEYAFICEDDLSLETLQYWDFTWENFIQTLPKDWDVIQLAVIRDEFSPHHFTFRKRDWNDWSLTAYIIKRDYAKRLIYKHSSVPLSFGYKFDVEINGTKLQPIGENIIYLQTENAYAVPLFVEDVQNFKTTLSSADKKYEYEELNGQQKNHITSYHEVMNWWKNNESSDELIHLEKYIENTENSENNYNLGRWYHNIGQTAAAISFYLRAADRSENDLLTYECLLLSADCFYKQQNRDYTVRSLYKRAITLLPKRPEAYYLLARFDEWARNYCDSYTLSSLALSFCDFDIEKIDSLEYPGKYGFIFEKAVSSYWWGKSEECRQLFKLLVDEYWNELDEKHRISVEDNLSRLGLTTQSQSFIMYNSSLHDKLRFNFEDSEKIDHNYSQVLQDISVLSILNGKKYGTFLEIGGGDYSNGSNTRLLEQNYNWSGVTVELNENHCKTYKNRKNTKIINANALKLDYFEILRNNYSSKIIDYLQLDIEPARNTYECLLKIPFDEYKFRVITYEHDDYIDVTKSCREESRKYLKEKGYLLLVNDISPEGVSNFEDWWVNPDFVDSDIIQRMISIKSTPHNVYDYMFNSKWYAEFETDKYIREKYFPDYTYKGVFVDVGAGPPSFISNSKHFRMYGWRTICIEPNPKFVQQHIENLSEVYEYACSDEEGSSKFVVNYNNDHWYNDENDGVSFSGLSIKYDGVPEHNTQEIINVKKLKLNTILQSHNIQKIDILSIDVEGWELEVLNGFDILTYSPKIIILENFENNSKYDEYMYSKGYTKDISLGYNIIYKQIINH